MESFIGLPVPAAVEPVPVGLSAGGGNGGHAADRSETCLARDALRVVARGDREFRGVDGAAPLHLQEGWRIGLDEPMHGALQLACFLIELQPGPGERPQGRKQRPGDVVFRIRAARPQFPVQARSLERPVFGPDPLRGRHQEGAYGVGYAGHGVDVYGSRHRKGAQALNPLVVGLRHYALSGSHRAGGVLGVDAIGFALSDSPLFPLGAKYFEDVIAAFHEVGA